MVRALLEDPLTQPYFSAASIWEVAIKNGLGRSDFRADLERLTRAVRCHILPCVETTRRIDMSKANLFYAQSGGVTAVINASACGVIETARKHPGSHRESLCGAQRHRRRAQ